jgi:toxin YoeB
MNLIFTEPGWEDYLFWQETDRRVLKKINALIKECTRSPYSGAGKPEQLRQNLSGWWSRRITEEHRLIYRVDDENLWIGNCRYHYSR